jgi:hypothetical protein
MKYNNFFFLKSIFFIHSSSPRNISFTVISFLLFLISIYVTCAIVAAINEGCPFAIPSSFTVNTLPPSPNMKDAIVVVGALRTAKDCIPRILRAFGTSLTPFDVFCVFSVDVNSIPFNFDAETVCNVVRFYNYTSGFIGEDVLAQLVGFPYDRKASVDTFPTAYNLANQLHLWKLAWTLIETQEIKNGQLYRSITRVRPDSFFSSSVFIDRDSWSQQSNWRNPRALFFNGQLLQKPYVIPQDTEMDFIVMTSTDQWEFPFSDQVAFGGRNVMK